MAYSTLEKRREWRKNNLDKVRAQYERYKNTEKGKVMLEKARERARAARQAYAISPEAIAKKEALEKQLAEWAATKKDREREDKRRQRHENGGNLRRQERRRAVKEAKAKEEGRVFIPKRRGLTQEEKREAKSIARRNRKSLEKAAQGKLSVGIRKKLNEAQKGKCPVCKSKLILDGAKKCHIDHVVPLSAGGTNTDDNVQLLCFECNVSKGAKNSVEFMQSRGFLL